MNPHVFLYIDEKMENGEVVNWGFECYAPNVLRHAGFFKDTLKIGDYITVTGWAAKDLKQRFAGKSVYRTDATSSSARRHNKSSANTQMRRIAQTP